MSVDFEEEQVSRRLGSPVRKSVFESLLIRYGLARDARSANTLMLIAASLCILAAIFIIISGQGQERGVPQEVFDASASRQQTLP